MLRLLLLLAIRLYWRLVPARRRRSCLFAESCSRLVYRAARSDGFLAGMRALALRRRQCRPGYVVQQTPDGVTLRVADGTLVRPEDVAPEVLAPVLQAVKRLEEAVTTGPRPSPAPRDDLPRRPG